MLCFTSSPYWLVSPWGTRVGDDWPVVVFSLVPVSSTPLNLSYVFIFSFPFSYLLLLLLLQHSQDNIPAACCLDKLILRCQPWFWCIPPALASSWPRSPAPTAETFQCLFWCCVYTATDCPSSSYPLHHSGQTHPQNVRAVRKDLWAG